jgi:fructokinase
MLAGIEAGGTKFVCGVGTGPQDLRTGVVATDQPKETLAQIADFFAPFRSQLQAGAVGSFGPVDLNPKSPRYGHITSTPKPYWAQFPLLRELETALGVPVAFETDVNAALVGEARWGAAHGFSDAVYVTIGTGIGAGAMVGGRLIHGLVHPEVGHLLIPHDRVRDPFPGMCPYHLDCAEGLSSGPAIAGRWGSKGADLPPTHEAWPLEAHYIALLLVNITLTLSPQRIVVGGGVMRREFLYPMVRRELQALLAGYVQSPSILDHIDDFIVAPELGGNAGVLGAIALAADLANQSQ